MEAKYFTTQVLTFNSTMLSDGKNNYSKYFFLNIYQREPHCLYFLSSVHPSRIHTWIYASKLNTTKLRPRFRSATQYFFQFLNKLFLLLSSHYRSELRIRYLFGTGMNFMFINILHVLISRLRTELPKNVYFNYGQKHPTYYIRSSFSHTIVSL